MIPETTILNLQAIATILMGYDYFCSDKLKEKVNTWANAAVSKYQTDFDSNLKQQMTRFKNMLPILSTGAISLVVSAGILICIRLINILSIAVNIKILFITILLITILPFGYISYRNLKSILKNGIAPFTLPLLLRGITTFLLYTSKGAVAGLGMIFLACAFTCRYINTYKLFQPNSSQNPLSTQPQTPPHTREAGLTNPSTPPALPARTQQPSAVGPVK